MMKEKLQNIKEEALKAIEAADMPEKLNDVRVKFLGKKGELTAVLKGMKDVAPEDRPKVGQMVNETRAAIEAVLEENKEKIEKAIRAEKLSRTHSILIKTSCSGHRHLLYRHVLWSRASFQSVSCHRDVYSVQTK